MSAAPLVVFVALLWMTIESRRLVMRAVWRYWVLALLFGMAGTLPLFLYARERQLVREREVGAPIRTAAR